MNISQLSKLILDWIRGDEKNRYYVLGGGLLAVFLLDYFLIMQPLQIKHLMALNPKITLLAKDLKQSKHDIKRQAEYSKNLVDIQSKMNMMESRVISREEIPQLLGRISQLANEMGVRINQVIPLRNQEELALSNTEVNYYFLPIQIHARGGYHAIGRFFAELENDHSFLNISDFTIAASQDDFMQHSLRMTLQTLIQQRTIPEAAK